MYVPCSGNGRKTTSKRDSKWTISTQPDCRVAHSGNHLSHTARVGVFFIILLGLFCGDMKNTNNVSQKVISGDLREHHLNRLIVRPLARRIKQQRRDFMEQSKRILNEIQDVNESIEIIVRQLAREAERRK